MRMRVGVVLAGAGDVDVGLRPRRGGSVRRRPRAAAVQLAGACGRERAEVRAQAAPPLVDQRSSVKRHASGNCVHRHTSAASIGDHVRASGAGPASGRGR